MTDGNPAFHSDTATGAAAQQQQAAQRAQAEADAAAHNAQTPYYSGGQNVVTLPGVTPLQQQQATVTFGLSQAGAPGRGGWYVNAQGNLVYGGAPVPVGTTQPGSTPPPVSPAVNPVQAAAGVVANADAAANTHRLRNHRLMLPSSWPAS